MSYYPYIRGKQFELLMLREMAPKIAKWGFVPIIEPVKGNFPALKRALDDLVKYNCRFILIANPYVGELKSDGSALWRDIIDGHLHGYKSFVVGLNLSAYDALDTLRNFLSVHSMPVSVVHCGFSDGRSLAELIGENASSVQENIFIEQLCTKLYRRNFEGFSRVLIRDGFQNRNKNSEYPPAERFSDLYLTYRDEEKCHAFGDFLIVGSDYKETGGPAYAIAIHLTYMNPLADNEIFVKHYLSDQNDTPIDPAGKFLEALRKLVADVQNSRSNILRTRAVEEFLQLYQSKHFPGLGYVKKLSMQHHLELMGSLLKS